MALTIQETIDQINDKQFKIRCEIVPKFITSTYPIFPEKSLSTDEVQQSFEQFIRKCRIKPDNFNSKMKEALQTADASNEFTDFLINYWLIVAGKAVPSTVDAAYATIVRKADQKTAEEQTRIFDQVNKLAELTFHENDPVMNELVMNGELKCHCAIYTSMYGMLWIMERCVISCGLLDYLESREFSVHSKASAVLGALYSTESTATAEEWLLYLFDFKPECKSAHSMLSKIMTALYETICSEYSK